MDRSRIAHINKKYHFIFTYSIHRGFPGGSVVNNPPANVGDMGLILVPEKANGEGNGNPLQCSYLGNPIDRGAWWATLHGVAKRQELVTKQQQVLYTDI